MMTTEQIYMKTWLTLAEAMASEGFTWSSLEEDEEFHQYMSYTVYEMTRSEMDAIRQATKAIGDVVNKTYHHILHDPALRSRLGLPVETWEMVSRPSSYFSAFTRLDLVQTDNGIRVIEINCDTPTGYLETSVANRIICEEAGLSSPNNLEDAIRRAWKGLVADYDIPSNECVYFTSYGWHDEDRETVLFNQKHSGLERTQYIPIETIVVAEDGLYDEEGKKIRFLYRLYPIEYLPEDEDQDGNPIGKQFIDHITSGAVTIINPPSAFMMQSKAVMGLIWELMESSSLYSEEEAEIIRTYFLPTYFTEEPFVSGGVPYVTKPIFGREGGGVVIRDQHGRVTEADEERWYSEWANIHQAYVEMPDFTVDTWEGPYTGKLLVGSFLIGGEPSGLFLRVGEKITGNLSMFCGVSVTD